MRLTLVVAFLAASALVSVALDPAQSNTKGKCPGPSFKCVVEKINGPIQAAECSHNTRTHKKQTFAVFVTDHKYDGNKGYPYGSCSAYTCEAPTSDQMIENDDCWTFSGMITTNQCGCEDSADGRFTAGKTNCT
ncbi:unnamed protein product [Peronospora destructor]|uniref:Small secreted protein n=1 Tax=Peronospora destructor TaxID=86335 RepID=A0AAV0VDV1_9STRA|nr:unnamed protein product [Peronospora destructor]